MAIPLRERIRVKPIPASPELKAERLAICAGCEHAVLTVAGKCDKCGKHHVVTGRDDADFACKRCDGQIRGKEVARCGACGCPLASRTHYARLPGYGPVRCPKGKW